MPHILPVWIRVKIRQVQHPYPCLQPLDFLFSVVVSFLFPTVSSSFSSTFCCCCLQWLLAELSLMLRRCCCYWTDCSIRPKFGRGSMDASASLIWFGGGGWRDATVGGGGGGGGGGSAIFGCGLGSGGN